MENEEAIIEEIEDFPEDEAEEEYSDDEEDEEYSDDEAEEELFRENPLKAIWIRLGEIKEGLEND